MLTMMTTTKLLLVLDASLLMLLLMLLLHLEENEGEHLFASFTKDTFIMFSPMNDARE